MEGIHRTARSAERARGERAGHHGDFMSARFSRTSVVVIEGTGTFRPDILNESAAESDVDDLDAAADGKDGSVALLCFSNERDFHCIARVVHRFQLRVRLGAEARRIHIFAAGKEEPIYRRENRRCTFCRSEGWNNEWYDACILNGLDIGHSEPDAPAVFVHTAGSGNGNDSGGTNLARG